MTNKQTFGRKGWTPERLGSLSGKTYAITGTTSGTGYEATRVFLSKGAKVVMLNRNADRANAVIATMRQELGSDAAAIFQVAKQEITVDGFESQLGVNHFGHFLLCGLLFERVEASKGRIVVVGSNGYKLCGKRIQFEDLNFDKNYTAWNAYTHSKLAQMMFAYELQRRVQTARKSVQVQVCHPGASRTNLLQDTASLPMRLLWSVASRFVAQSAEKGSWPAVMCATEEGLKSEAYYGPTKRSELIGPIGECSLEAHALDREEAAKLWTISKQKTSLSWSL